jgi:predicted permease
MNVALILVPDFLLIALGAALRRWPALTPAFWSGLERLIYFVLFPALLVRSLAHAPLGSAGAATLVAIVVAATLAGIALGALAGPLFRLPPPTFGASFQCAFRFNTYVVLAVAVRMGGDGALALAALLVGVLVPIVNVAAVAGLARGRALHVGRELARNPLLIACVVGLAANALSLPLPEWLDSVVAALGAAALPLGLIAVGAALSLTRGNLPYAALAWFHAIKLVAMPALAFGLARYAQLPPLETSVAVLMTAVPTAPSAYILASQMGGDGRAAAWLISTSTLVAAVTLPLWLSLVLR